MFGFLFTNVFKVYLILISNSILILTFNYYYFGYYLFTESFNKYLHDFLQVEKFIFMLCHLFNFTITSDFLTYLDVNYYYFNGHCHKSFKYQDQIVHVIFIFIVNTKIILCYLNLFIFCLFIFKVDFIFFHYQKFFIICIVFKN